MSIKTITKFIGDWEASTEVGGREVSITYSDETEKACLRIGPDIRLSLSVDEWHDLTSIVERMDDHLKLFVRPTIQAYAEFFYGWRVDEYEADSECAEGYAIVTPTGNELDGYIKVEGDGKKVTLYSSSRSSGNAVALKVSDDATEIVEWLRAYSPGTGQSIPECAA